MQAWAWIAVGAILLGSELTFVDAQFYLLFVGGSALIVGFLTTTGLVPVAWLQWLIFALLAVGSTVGFRRRFYERLRRKLPIVKHGPAGEILTLPDALPPGETCRVEFRGSSWSAKNCGDSIIAAGGSARIDRVDGLTLVVHGDR